MAKDILIEILKKIYDIFCGSIYKDIYVKLFVKTAKDYYFFELSLLIIACIGLYLFIVSEFKYKYYIIFTFFYIVIYIIILYYSILYIQTI